VPTSSSFPGLPKVQLEVVADRSEEREGFLELKRFDMVVIGEDGRRSTTFRYDLLERRALDAAVMAAHHVGTNGRPFVYLRSAVRPPPALRRTAPFSSGALWELPAGLIEPGEEPVAAAARELEEELGFAVAAAAMHPLGGFSFPAPGFVGEVHWFFHVRVDPVDRREPVGDGSPLEDAARVVSVPLDEALAACTSGIIRDAKTELALRRLVEILDKETP
jgi:ADP-ribose pyrophosphatase